MTSKSVIKGLSFILLALSLSACMGTRESRLGEGSQTVTLPAGNLFERHVQYDISDAFFQRAPRCVTVLPMENAGQSRNQHSTIVEEAFTRHLYTKLDKVISPRDRDHLSRQLAFDLTVTTDRKTWARQQKCGYFLSLKPLDDQGNYLFFWSRKAVGVEARLIGPEENDILWRGQHVADRYNGGLPLSPFDAAMAVFKANSFEYDKDIHLSLADDLARRILATFPSLRMTASSY